MWNFPPFPVLAGHTPTAQMAEVSQAEMAAALTVVDSVHVLDRKKVSPTSLGHKEQGGTQCNGGQMSSEPPREGPSLTH